MRQHCGRSDIHALKTVSSTQASATDVSSTLPCAIAGDGGRQAPSATAIASIPPQLLGVTAAIEIKRVVKMPLAAEGFLVVVALGGGEPLEPFRDRLEAP